MEAWCVKLRRNYWEMQDEVGDWGGVWVAKTLAPDTPL